MSKKFANDLCDELKALIAQEVRNAGLDQVADIRGFRLTSSKGPIYEIAKGNAVTEVLSGQVIVIAVFEEAMLKMSEASQQRIIEGAVSNISYDLDKDKLSVKKPELNVSLGMWIKYGKDYVNDLEASLVAVEQINEGIQRQKDEEKELKKMKKNK